MRKKHIILFVLMGLVPIAGPKNAHAESGEIDWQSVEALAELDAATRLSCVLRMIDYWHEGHIQEMRLSYDESEKVLDDGRDNTQEVTPEEWKGMVLFVHNLVQKSGRDSTPWRALPYNYDSCGDDLGKMQRFAYRVKMEDKLTLAIQVIRPIYVEGVD